MQHIDWFNCRHTSKLISVSKCFCFHVTNGFSNCEDAIVSFKNHKLSIFHKEAVMVMVTLSSTTPDIGELLSKQHAAEKLNSQYCLFQIMLCVRFMGLAL